MKNCKGIGGWMFGHKFRPVMLEYYLKHFLPEIDGYNISEIVKLLADKKYKIVCKRCGEELK